LIEDINGPSEIEYQKKSYEVVFNALDDRGTQAGQWLTDEINVTIKMFHLINKHVDVYSCLDESQSVRLKVANIIKAKKHGITTIQVGSLTSSFGDSPRHRVYEFNVRALMSFSIT
jgi:hypothetical protein